MLSAHHLNKSYGLQVVLSDVTFNLSAGERLGLVGPNGCGKSTLLRILAGEEPPDSGLVIRTRPGLRLGMLPQGFTLDPALTLAEACAPSGPCDPAAEVARLASALAANPTDPAIQAAYDASLHHLEQSTPPVEVLASLGLAGLPPGTPVGRLSGGQKTRLLLARLLFSAPHLLLLDEPTNHLDLRMLEWLEAWLVRFRGAVLLVSHDRLFLDNTVTGILELHLLTHRLEQYPGNFSAFTAQKEAALQRQQQAYQDQQASIHHMQADILRTKAQAAHTERAASSIRIGGPDYKRKGFKSYQQGIAKKVAAKAKAREKKLERFIASEEIVGRPPHEYQLKLHFPAPSHLSRDVLQARDLAIGYPGCPPLVAGLCLQVRGGERIALTGPNGCGKTTLLRTIAGRLPSLGGSLVLGATQQLGYMAQEQELLDLFRSPLELVQQAASFNTTRGRAFLHAFLFSGDSPLRPCGEMSFGERTRLELALLIARGSTFLLLDEPTNHLDIPSRQRFESALGLFPGTVLAVIHDRHFIRSFATSLWVLEDGRIAVRSLESGPGGGETIGPHGDPWSEESSAGLDPQEP